MPRRYPKRNVGRKPAKARKSRTPQKLTKKKPLLRMTDLRVLNS